MSESNPPLRDAALTPSRIEKAGKRLAKGIETPDDLDLIASFQRYVRRVTAGIYPRIAAHIREEFFADFDITQRSEKRLDSIRRKLQREKTRLQTMQDHAGCRVVTLSVLASGEIGEILAGYFSDQKAARMERQIRDGRRTGYRSLHYKIGVEDVSYETQIRTDVENAWAQLAERFDEQYPGVKYGEGDRRVFERLKQLADACRIFEERRAELIHERAGESDVHPAHIPEIRLERRRIDVLFAEMEGFL